MLELFTTRNCPHCATLRDQLDWEQREYVEYDVESDSAARGRLTAMLGVGAMVPALVEEGRVTQVGVAGRGCYVGGG